LTDYGRLAKTFFSQGVDHYEISVTGVKYYQAIDIGFPSRSQRKVLCINALNAGRPILTTL
ncbi:MAG: hypothetical protein KA447_12390, partial [Pyrinomonadaceae bacterium]|nr:hypothetical protein [Pyrinomonadaceae bacterium]